MSEQHEAQRSPEELRRQYKLAQELLSDLSWELEELELRLRTLQEEGATDPLVAREAEDLRRRRARQEELVLQQMLSIDTLRAQLDEAQSLKQQGKEQPWHP